MIDTHSIPPISGPRALAVIRAITTSIPNSMIPDRYHNLIFPMSGTQKLPLIPVLIPRAPVPMCDNPRQTPKSKRGNEISSSSFLPSDLTPSTHQDEETFLAGRPCGQEERAKKGEQGQQVKKKAPFSDLRITE